MGDQYVHSLQRVEEIPGGCSSRAVIEGPGTLSRISAGGLRRNLPHLDVLDNIALWPRARPRGAPAFQQLLQDEGFVTTGRPPTKPSRAFWSIQRQQVAPQTVQELRGALVHVWKEIPHDAICCLIRRIGEQVEGRGGKTGILRRDRQRARCWWHLMQLPVKLYHILHLECDQLDLRRTDDVLNSSSFH